MRRPSHSAATVVLVALLAGGGLVACSTHSADTYSRDELGKAMTLSRGTVLAVREVKVEGNTYGVGMAAGAVMGGAGGSMASSSDATVRVIGAVGGAVLGGLLGMLIEQGITADTAMEVVVQLDSGKTQAYVEKIEDPLVPGDRVVVMNSERVRIIRDTSGTPAPVMIPAAPTASDEASGASSWAEPPGMTEVQDGRSTDDATLSSGTASGKNSVRSGS